MELIAVSNGTPKYSGTYTDRVNIFCFTNRTHKLNGFRKKDSCDIIILISISKKYNKITIDKKYWPFLSVWVIRCFRPGTKLCQRKCVDGAKGDTKKRIKFA